MTTQNQKAYLQKYLSGPSKDKKKKKKKEKKAIKGKGFKIIDDDLDLSKLRALETDELDIYGEGEDAPQVAGIIDDRPLEMRKLEQFKTSSKWRVINQDDGFNSKIQIEEINQSAKEVEKENEIIFGKMYSDSEDERERDSKKQTNDSDASPPRKSNKKQTKNEPRESNRDNDSDASPPRKHSSDKESRKEPRMQNNKPKKSRKNEDCDESPPRKSRSNDDKQRKESRKQNYDSDASLPRKSSRNKDSDESPPRKSRNSDDKQRKESRNQNNDSDASPPRKSRRNKDSDESPPRKSRKNDNKQSKKHNDSDPSPTRKHTSKQSNDRQQSRQYDSDTSPSRKSRRNYDQLRKQNFDRDSSPPRKRDKSPKRHKNRDRIKKSRWGDFEFEKNEVEMINQEYEKKLQKSQSPKKNDSDTSPPRKRDNKRKHDSDSDISPPRKNTERDRNSRNKDRYNKDSPPPTNKKMEKTLEGKMAGLQDARQLRMENESFRRREEEVFNKLADDVSGRNAQAVSRKGKRETSEDRNKQREKMERQKEIDDKYKRWSKGLKQIEDQQDRIQDYMHEASKPLARHKGDKDLEERLKDIDRDGDPMLQYIRERKREIGVLPPERPSYKGNFPPNRFNIRPGHRWDGVDRSNGYEKKYFDQQSKRKAQEEEAYKWSTEDL